jgi:hypothetical protein
MMAYESKRLKIRNRHDHDGLDFDLNHGWEIESETSTWRGTRIVVLRRPAVPRKQAATEAGERFLYRFEQERARRVNRLSAL